MGTAIDSQGYAADSVAAAPNLHAAVAGGDIGLVFVSAEILHQLQCK